MSPLLHEIIDEDFCPVCEEETDWAETESELEDCEARMCLSCQTIVESPF